MTKVLKKPIVFLVFLCMLFTMTPMTVFALENEVNEGPDGKQFTTEILTTTPTTLTFYYVEKNNVGKQLSIASVEHDSTPDGVPDGIQISQGYTITIPDSVFDDKAKIQYDASAYVPTWIFDTEDYRWELNDKGSGQQSILIDKGIENEHTFHYKDPVYVPPTPAPTSGSITITKVVDGDTPTADADFTFSITGPESYTNSVTITGKGSDTIDGLVPGTYTITEVNVPTNYTLNTSPQSVEVVAGETETVTFTNTYSAPTPPDPPVVTPGVITVIKDITGGTPLTDADFTFSITGPESYSNSVTITGEGSTTIPGLTPGAYTIAEADAPTNYTKNTSPQSVTVSAGETVSVTFTNNYTDPTPPGPATGTLTITKYISGDEPGFPEMFTFSITGPGAYTNSVTIRGEGSTTIYGLVPGTYVVTEGYAENYEPVIDGDTDTPAPYYQEAAVQAGGSIEVLFTNRFTSPLTPDASVYKSVALYDGVNMPNANAYTDKLTLNQLGQKVMYKIELFANAIWAQREKAAGLFDIYRIGVNEEDITNELYVMTSDGLLKADENVFDFPEYLWLSPQSPLTFYYFDQLSANGTYTNTAYLYESQYQTPTFSITAAYPDPIASSSAVVTVNYNPAPPPPPPNDDDDNNKKKTAYYEVTYDANYPSGSETSGTVPTDGKDYTYNSFVTVIGNTGELKAADFTFKAWNTKADGTGIFYLPDATFRITSDITLYAQWEPVTAVAAAEDVLDDVPQTGTKAPLIPMLLLGLFSLASIAFLGMKKPGSAKTE